jgi:hypothetical protein
MEDWECPYGYGSERCHYDEDGDPRPDEQIKSRNSPEADGGDPENPQFL